MNKLLVESHLTQGVLSKVLCLDGKALENLAFCFQIHFNVWVAKGLASYCKAETTFTFHFSIINA